MASRKFVEIYNSQLASQELGVSRGDYVAMAYLLGSDYAEGVRGIGIVNAMEIVRAFNMKTAEGKLLEFFLVCLAHLICFYRVRIEGRD